MNLYEERKVKQMEQLGVREGEKKKPAKQVNIVSLKMVREKSLLYPERAVRSLEDGYRLFKQFLGELDWEYFVVMCLDTKNQPTAINICHVGSLNASIVHPSEVMKAAILSNVASILIGILIGHNYPWRVPEEPREDVEVTKRLVETGKIIGIDVLDHLVIGDGKYVSLKDKGYI
ncbi:JAB domain-containing protein [Bacillus badius]|uniref:JAB domain-containing protein n=1 Tax=Bacillus badius TaxID=1455 RepID=UPI002E218737|nr:JAB domain-containing protein [Bacillus badius]